MKSSGFICWSFAFLLQSYAWGNKIRKFTSHYSSNMLVGCVSSDHLVLTIAIQKDNFRHSRFRPITDRPVEVGCSSTHALAHTRTWLHFHTNTYVSFFIQECFRKIKLPHLYQKPTKVKLIQVKSSQDKTNQTKPNQTQTCSLSPAKNKSSQVK